MDSRKRKYEDGTSSESEVDRKLLIAIDFGTTYSGLAWVQTRKPELQCPITQWPNTVSGSLEGTSNDKVPTEIKYDGQDLSWGFQINDSDLRHRFFKLDLDPSQCRRFSLAVAFPDSMATLAAADITVEKLVTDYLTSLRKHADQVLRHKFPESALMSTQIEFIITIPAVWSDSARMKTRKCAQDAGMGSGSSLHMISEPEAAATFALDAMDPHDVKIGDTFVLVDAGGGTVDLISYKVEALRPMLKIKETSPGSGSLCGSSFLNRIFQNFLRDKLGKEDEWDEEILEEATKRFETVIKRSFQDNPGEEYQVPVAGLADNPHLGIRRGKYRMTGAEVKKIFDPEVIDLVLNQIEGTKEEVKAVLLVGGFGQNAYLRECIRGAIGEIRVMQSPHGSVIDFLLRVTSADYIRWTAVVRGALMKGLASISPTFAKVEVTSRSARKHYGTVLMSRYDGSKHKRSRRYWDRFDGYHLVNTMEWFINKGANVKENAPFRLLRHIERPVKLGRPKKFDEAIYVSTDDDNEGPPLYPDDDDVLELVALKADLSRVPENDFPQVTGADQELHFQITYAIEITHFSACTTYELNVNGINYGAVKAEYV
ncbi:hypothetical protein MMC20_005098 [Loxospora ochrophaea]|nr:hypothetical protein [Loxospora ochrophaea]